MVENKINKKTKDFLKEFINLIEKYRVAIYLAEDGNGSNDIVVELDDEKYQYCLDVINLGFWFTYESGSININDNIISDYKKVINNGKL